MGVPTPAVQRVARSDHHSDRLATAIVLAHFDASGGLRADLKSFIDACAARPDVHVVLVSTSLAASVVQTLPSCIDVIVRPNVGYDFYSYKVGIEHMLSCHGSVRSRMSDSHGPDACWPDHTKLVLMNSSFYIARPLELLKLVQQPSEPDVMGLTLSDEHQRHLQSYLVCFGSRVVRSAHFLRWWREMVPISDRESVIRAYELPMTRYLEDAGFSVGAWFAPTLLQRVHAIWRNRRFQPRMIALMLTRSGRRVNPTLYYWWALWSAFGVAKVELLERNPHGWPLQLMLRDPAFRYKGQIKEC
jgi:Rhamnan synthesis protein F